MKTSCAYFAADKRLLKPLPKNRAAMLNRVSSPENQSLFFKIAFKNFLKLLGDEGAYCGIFRSKKGEGAVVATAAPLKSLDFVAAIQLFKFVARSQKPALPHVSLTETFLSIKKP